LTPNPIRKVLSTLAAHQVRYLLMGGQACVLYGAAEFSRDADFAILASPANLLRLRRARRELELADALLEEERSERNADRQYWLPLRAELEKLRHSALPSDAEGSKSQSRRRGRPRSSHRRRR